MTDELSPEDQFRLNVLLTQDIKAVRIDEGGLVLSALLGNGEEASLPLHANCRADKYLRRVREALSGHALGSPGGYPVYLSRWTRHGQMESANLGQLLLIGEPEAVVAVVHSPALTDELAGHAWWAMPTIEHAVLMLMREAVAKGRMGPVLADFLIEHLAFLQEDHLAIMDAVAVLLRSGILGAGQRDAVWRRGKRQNSYYVAFLENWPADMAAPAFVEAACEILSRPDTQEVVSRTLDAIGRHYAAATDPAGERLGRVSAALAEPVFSRSTAIGSLMRRKLEPVLAPVLADLRSLA